MKAVHLVLGCMVTLAGCSDPSDKSFGLVCAKEGGQPLDIYVVHPRDKVIETLKPWGEGLRPAKQATFAGPRIYASFGSDYTDTRGTPITITAEIDLDDLSLKWHTDYREGTTYYGRCEIRDLDDPDWGEYNS